jgi:hypothetical protein
MDFNIGSWKAHIKLLRTPLTGTSTWVELNGTAVVRRLWSGCAQLEEVEVDGSIGHFEALVLLLYDPQSHQWSKSFANGNDGQLTQPMIGEFNNARGEFYDQETYHGRAALMRAVWSDITVNSQHFQESFSYDGARPGHRTLSRRLRGKDRESATLNEIRQREARPAGSLCGKSGSTQSTYRC